MPGLVEGEAIVRVVAERAGTWLRHPDPVVKELRLPVRLSPPALALLSSQHYVAQGGSGVVVYRVGADRGARRCARGLLVLPRLAAAGRGKEDRLALFGVPWDLSDAAALRLVAEDDAGNAAELAFVDRFFPKPPARDTIVLDDAFLAKVVPEIRAQTPGLEDRGSLLDNYLQINRDLRKRNAEELPGARAALGGRLPVDGALPRRCRNAKVMSAFADRRTYVYQGREVDHQTHLGFDLAVGRAHAGARRQPRASSSSRATSGSTATPSSWTTASASRTLYAHLSSIEVKEGQTVERGTILGHTGATGLAGGDHLHFTTLVRGLPVNPVEWWDGALDPRPRGVEGGPGRPRLQPRPLRRRRRARGSRGPRG